MFFKQNARLAYEAVGNESASRRSAQAASAAFAMGSEAEDNRAFGFGAGNSQQQRTAPRQAPNRGNQMPPRRRPPRRFGSDKRTLYIAIAAAAAALLVLLFVIIGIATSDKSIVFQ